ncbi:hypothetical protein P4E94_01570 [Pontiellaceae bacterium B12219]|nr:hypothetical protein [Pontiellaceae bacterium B12219]
MKKVLRVIAAALMIAGLTGCCSICVKGEDAAMKKACPPDCAKPCCDKPES